MERTMARLKLAGKRTRGARTLVSLSLSLPSFLLTTPSCLSSHRSESAKPDSFADKTPRVLDPWIVRGSGRCRSGCIGRGIAACGRCTSLDLMNIPAVRRATIGPAYGLAGESILFLSSITLQRSFFGFDWSPVHLNRSGIARVL